MNTLAQWHRHRRHPQVASNTPRTPFQYKPALAFVKTYAHVLQTTVAQAWIGTPKANEQLVPFEQLGVSRLGKFVPSKLGADKCVWRLRIRNVFWFVRETWKLAPPSLTYHGRQDRIAVVGKIKKGGGGSPFFT